MGWIDELNISERLIPGKISIDVFLWHLARYHFAKRFCLSRNIIDMGCGTGYGSYYLARSGTNRVTGIDISPKAIEFATDRYKLDNLEFCISDASEIDLANLPSNYFDVIVAFELIEHLENPEKALAKFRRILRKRGYLIVSTPNKTFSSGINPYHVQEFTRKEFVSLLSKNFRLLKLFGQRMFARKKRRFSRLVPYIPKRTRKTVLEIYKIIYWSNVYSPIPLHVLWSYYKNPKHFEDKYSPIPLHVLWSYYKNPKHFEDKMVGIDLPDKYQVKPITNTSERYEVLLAVCATRQ